MPDHLVFTLTAALASMGELAGHERRGSLTWPGRSAITGLLGAAMGLRRDADFSALEGLGLAVAVFERGGHLRDYHTVETVPTAAARAPASRPEALKSAQGRTNTMITLRDYRTSPLFGVALWGADDLLFLLEAALREPVFTLYFGRKSCPLGAPLAPRIIDAEGPVAALGHLRLPPWFSKAEARVLIADADTLPGRIEQRQDRVLSREQWHFGPRSVVVADVTIQPQSRSGEAVE